MKSLAWVVCLFVILKIFDKVDCGCTLSLENDFGRPSPVLLRNDAYLKPDTNGSISLRHLETLRVACPGRPNYVTLSNSTRNNIGRNSAWDVRCVGNSLFKVSKSNVEFRNLVCHNHPMWTTEDMQRTGRVKGNMHRVGYLVKGRFYALYEVCVDKKRLTTYYVKHDISPQSHYQQYGSSRPSFIGGSFFGIENMSELYSVQNQRARLDTILGPSESHQYITKSQVLTRGHLAAMGDFPLNAQMYATFHYANIAPQWQSANSGNWATLEDKLRDRVHELGRSVTVYTGTHGVFTLPDVHGVRKPIYLAVDKNNKAILPVPMYFYKLVYDPQTEKAVAIVSINSGFYNRTEISSLTFCRDICGFNKPQYKWLKWRVNHDRSSFCCNYDDFVNEVKNLPILNVRGEFY